ncbi:hypothetical protein [Cryptosporangium phraense]|uniref:Uncharacterized protein n=1 Tax=Cryptosporangium phraense TaxID=2593070 RepID=A0A545AIQ3_9ACTN|nr:hypothetical protein [Cryptosporangium phraense]TQS41204.1 hypothetical protein FL583_31235 [Cryptosporangium phraense]
MDLQTLPARGVSVLGVGAMFALAVLDLAAAYCAVRYLRTGHWAWWTVGAAGMVALFGVYAASLEYAELATVTLGWIVILQVGVVVLDRVANGVVLPPAKLLAIAGILLLMTYLVLAPNRQ